MIVGVGLWVVDTTMSVARLPLPGESVAVSAIGRSEGGKAANQVIAAARLGAQTALLGVVGDQEGWHDPLATLRDEGVDITGLHFAPGVPNGSSVILLTPDGEQVIATYSGPGERIDVARTVGALRALEATTLLLQGETDPGETLQVGRAFDGRVIFDPSPVGPFIGADLGFADILTPNWSEAQRLTGKAAPTATDVRLATRAACVVLTRGADGAEVSEPGRSFTVPAPTATPLDPTGAGDAFNGALATALEAGRSLEESVRFAVRVAAWSVERPYCIPSYPTLAELESATASVPDEPLIPEKEAR